MSESKRNFVPGALWILVAAAMAAMAIALLLAPMNVTPEPESRIRCLSNLRQLGLGLKQYARDCDEKYPWSVGRTDPGGAWRDLGFLYPDYVDDIDVYLCPSSGDREFDPISSLVGKADQPFEPFRDRPNERISYSYCFDARNPGRPSPWTENSPAWVLLLADKKAGMAVGTPDNPVEMASHGDDGRNVLYQDGHATWWSGKKALDPGPDDDEIGPPDLPDYTAWWSDPPYYGE
jgi:prepilin-type processing-associated H-X9-DG protein